MMDSYVEARLPVTDYVSGDHLKLPIPAHGDALAEAGSTFLTEAFQACGVLSRSNAVVAVTRWEACSGGSTGSKYFIEVKYSQASPALASRLFVKFSRDFSDPIRDQAKFQLESEVKLALLSREPGFPIRVPRCYYADYHHDSGTGVLITECIPFGEHGVEPLHEKCLDYQVPNCLEHYRAIIKALATLAGTQKAGELGVGNYFPFDSDKQSLSAPIRYDEAQLQRRIDKLEVFSQNYPGLLADNIASGKFIERMRSELPQLLNAQTRIKNCLHQNSDYIGLIHWNANIDNAWFWRDGAGTLHCGLMDWGGVGQMNLGLALWGALSAAETSLWRDHEETLLHQFIADYARAGGPVLELATLQQHLYSACAMMSLSWLMDAPAMIQRGIPNLASVKDRFAPEFETNESPRVQLQMLANFLDLWERRRFVTLPEQLP